MPIKKDTSGRRWVELEFEVPGTPEQVWDAIATGPGISSWFVPSEVEEREGGRATADFGPGMQSMATLRVWDPPHRWVADSKDLGEDAPQVASEWVVEARSGGTCIVRVVHSLFADGDDWDDQLEGWEHGWPAFFRILRIYLQSFPGQPSSAFQLMGMAPPPRDQAWRTFTGALGLEGARSGEKVRSGSEAPSLAGVVEGVGAEGYPELLLRLDEPAPGCAHLFPMEMGDQVLLSVRLYLYGDTAAEVSGREEPRWQEWVGQRFPATGFPPES